MLQKDIEEVLITEEEIQEKVAELGAVLTADYQDKFPLAIGVLKGALPFMSDLSNGSMLILNWISWTCRVMEMLQCHPVK